jgi:hypothetical protein
MAIGDDGVPIQPRVLHSTPRDTNHEAGGRANQVDAFEFANGGSWENCDVDAKRNHHQHNANKWEVDIKTHRCDSQHQPNCLEIGDSMLTQVTCCLNTSTRIEPSRVPIAYTPLRTPNHSPLNLNGIISQTIILVRQQSRYHHQVYFEKQGVY